MKNKELEAVKASLQEHISQKHSEIVHLQADKSNLLSQIDNLNASAKEQSKVIEELKTELIAQTNNTEYLSYKNRKHLKQLRVLITLLAVSLIGLTISILL
jgi:peptidoglycan hydrolase CwlO-like protein